MKIRTSQSFFDLISTGKIPYWQVKARTIRKDKPSRIGSAGYPPTPTIMWAGKISPPNPMTSVYGVRDLNVRLYDKSNLIVPVTFYFTNPFIIAKDQSYGKLVVHKHNIEVVFIPSTKDAWDRQQ